MNPIKYLFGGIEVKPEISETYEERRFRNYIRALNNPVILSPEEWVDPYAVTWEGRGTGRSTKKEGY